MKSILLKWLNFLKVPYLFRFLFQKNSITILYYHDVEKETFKEHVLFLKKLYNIIDLEILCNYLYNQRKKIPKYSLLITFDDGHIGNYNLLEIFKKSGIRPTIFLTSGVIDTLTPFWFKIPYIDPAEKAMLKLVSDFDRREYLNSEYEKMSKPSLPQALTKAMIEKMLPYVDFQSHTIDHPCLPNCSKEEASFQIYNSKSMVEDLTGSPVIAIAYPNGDFSLREIDICKKAGYTLGFASKSGFVNKKSNPLAINRLSVNDAKDINEFILRSTGVWSILKKVKF